MSVNVSYPGGTTTYVQGSVSKEINHGIVLEFSEINISLVSD